MKRAYATSDFKKGPEDSPVVAIACSDAHISYRPPPARSSEPDWFQAMRRPWQEIRALSHSHGDVPILFSGDLFDDGWRAHKCPPALTNWALIQVPRMYSIPGQHDLPNHALGELHRSAYWTLVECGLLLDVKPGVPLEVMGKVPMRLHGFPWGVEATPLEDPKDLYLEIALVHQYLWVEGKGYEGAPEEARVKKIRKKLKGYDLALTGDNHTHFHSKPKEGTRGCEVWNSGALTKRRTDDRDHRPCVGLVNKDGTVTKHYLDCSEDVFLDSPKEEARESHDFETLLRGLDSLTDQALDFADSLRRALKDAPEGVKQMVLKALGGNR